MPFQFTLQHAMLAAPGASVFFALISFTGGAIPGLVAAIPVTYFLLLFISVGGFVGDHFGIEREGRFVGYFAWVVAAVWFFWAWS
jgi:hypothetical protein